MLAPSQSVQLVFDAFQGAFGGFFVDQDVDHPIVLQLNPQVMRFLRMLRELSLRHVHLSLLIANQQDGYVAFEPVNHGVFYDRRSLLNHSQERFCASAYQHHWLTTPCPAHIRSRSAPPADV
jgi:hypothetical protein